jgi:integral membrane protein
MNTSHTPIQEDKDIKLFLNVGKLEGYSYLVLLFVAMPLKYLLNLPLAVKYTGTLHGVLFVAFIFTILVLFSKKNIQFYTIHQGSHSVFDSVWHLLFKAFTQLVALFVCIF